LTNLHQILDFKCASKRENNKRKKTSIDWVARWIEQEKYVEDTLPHNHYPKIYIVMHKLLVGGRTLPCCSNATQIPNFK
jgi:hypothetical protein